MTHLYQTIRLNMIPGAEMTPRVHVSQGDAGSRTLSFSLYAGQAVYTLPEGAEITCDGQAGDGSRFSVEAAGSGSTVTLTVSGEMTARAGATTCQITVRDQDNVLGSANFLLLVEPTP